MSVDVTEVPLVDVDEFERLCNEARSTELIRRQDTYNIGKHKLPVDAAWWQNVCRQLWERIEVLESKVAGLKLVLDEAQVDVDTKASLDAAAEVIARRGPSRPKNS